MSRREDILQKAFAIPQMPMPVQKVLAYIGNPEADLRQLARIIEYDPGLTVNVLRMANSSFFGTGGKVTSVREALMRLGLNRVYQLVIASGVAPMTRYEIKGYGLRPGELLEHSVAVATASETLAKELGRVAPPHTFTAGLLVNIGKTVMGSFLEVDAIPILALAHERHISFEQAEEEILGINHAELGAILLERWSIPIPIVNVVRYRLRPDDCPEPDLALDLVHVGDVIAKMTGIGMGIDGMQYTPSEAVFARLDISPEQMEAVMEAILEQIAEVREILIESTL
ncbi:HDOD domain-containing protein [Solidesulfovibrio sp.]|uniref:HDOD domain-containing protein n=1 Tax=Solidesulfovibrio sp. TaxID=2910990 RepID=UPI000EE71B17|nr:HDOD domain-containing protein [Solidesulfovibrio sp.]MEA5088389.1 HDOD domain-containing protein [Solidesulfovibrio sp.]HCR13405.1 histidine kinase [Desulfovibrio sp.]HML59457.1 HDOD domain-containing protein [Solidesulfovibrio sp.]